MPELAAGSATIAEQQARIATRVDIERRAGEVERERAARIAAEVKAAEQAREQQQRDAQAARTAAKHASGPPPAYTIAKVQQRAEAAHKAADAAQQCLDKVKKKHGQIERLTQPGADFNVRAAAEIQLRDLTAELATRERELEVATAAAQVARDALDRGEFELQTARHTLDWLRTCDRGDARLMRMALGDYLAHIDRCERTIARLTGEPAPDLVTI